MFSSDLQVFQASTRIEPVPNAFLCLGGENFRNLPAQEWALI